MRKLLLLSLPFVLAAVLALVRPMITPKAGLLPLLAFVPALAAWASVQVTAKAGARGAYTATAGAFALVSAAVSQAFLPAAEVRELVAYAAVAAVTVISIVITVQRERADLDLIAIQAVANMAQDVILRPVPPRVGRVSLAARSVSADAHAHVGGDFFEVAASGTTLRLVMGDVQGHGLPALRVMVLALGMFREAAWREYSLIEIAARMDRRLCQELGPEQFVTAVFAEIDADAGLVSLICCGHPPPLLITPAGAALACPETSGAPLGVGIGPWSSRRHTAGFKPGNTLVFYTDGLSEARDALGRFFPLLERAALEPPGGLVESLVSQAQEHAGGDSRDDMALLVAHYEDLP